MRTEIACPAWTAKMATFTQPPALCACLKTLVGGPPPAGGPPSDRDPIGVTSGIDNAPTDMMLMRTCNRYWSCHDRSMKHRQDSMQVVGTHKVGFLLLIPCSACLTSHAHSDIELAKALSELENPRTKCLSPLVPLPSLSPPSPPENTSNAGLTWLHHPLEGATPHSPDNDLSWLPERGEVTLLR